MKTISTINPELTLVNPDPDRDTPFAIDWFAGEAGIRTLQLMGNADAEITTTSYEKEHQIIEEFLDLEEAGQQLTWAVRYRDKTIGAVWIELFDTAAIPAPAVSIMIGDVSVRGEGLGAATVSSVLYYLKTETRYTKAYARHLLNNTASKKLLSQLGFVEFGEPYAEKNGLRFQNVVIDLANLEV